MVDQRGWLCGKEEVGGGEKEGDRRAGKSRGPADYHYQTTAPVVETPLRGNMQYAGGMGFRRAEVPGYDGAEDLAVEEGREEVVHRRTAIRPPAQSVSPVPLLSPSPSRSFPFRSKNVITYPHSLEVPRTDPLPHPPPLQIPHQLQQACLRFLRLHRGCFDGADGGHGCFLRRGRGERVDVVEDVGGFGDAERGSAGVEGGGEFWMWGGIQGRAGRERGRMGVPHFGEHVGLRDTGGGWGLLVGEEE